MRVAIKKVPGVETIDVSLERAVADVRLRPGNTLTLPQLRQIIKDNGFTSREATVDVVGTLVDRRGKPALNVTGTDIVIEITADAKAPDVFRRVRDQATQQTGRSVELRGIVTSTSSGPDELAVSAVVAPLK